MDPLKETVEDLLGDETFLRYCNGEDKADVAAWESWISAHPDKLPVVNAAKKLYTMLSLGQGNRLEQLSALKDAVARRARFKEQVANKEELIDQAPATMVPLRRRVWLKYAAGFLLLITAALLAWLALGNRGLARPGHYEYYTGLHDRKTILLPDSTVVMLNDNSHLSINKDFDAHHRQVTITGEAFFDVQHDPAHPFLVNTTQYTIRVLGTTFNVRSYPGKDTTATTLITGKIEILQTAEGKSKPAVVLMPNEQFLLAMPVVATPAAGKVAGPLPALVKGNVVKPAVDTASHRISETAWARSRMEIKDKTLAEIAVQLQAWYGIAIRFKDDKVKNYRYTASFDDETIINALRYLQQSYPFNYSIEDDCIVIASN